MTGIALVLSIVGGLGCAVAGGVLFGFSTFVMHALGNLPAPQGIAAMQSINVAAVRPALMGELFGTAAICVGASVTTLWTNGPARFAVLAATVCYLIGVIGVTGTYHQPRNAQLALVDPNAPGAQARWTRYVDEWTSWNHLRTVTAVIAAALLVIGAVNV